jgi:Asp-tRNA(Asn)/Glu-tRNA(Gln) amidotransferase A subunit family amidase
LQGGSLTAVEPELVSNAGLLGGTGGTEIRRRLLSGELSCAELADALIAAVGDDPLHAWATFDTELVRRRAAVLDGLAFDQRVALPMYGMPVAIKDIFDTAEEPTAYGSSIYAGHRPARDAVAVSRLREAGALIAGKSATAEFAVYSPPATLNPLDRSRTPGGSSSGSAAAVGAGTVPLATATQTGGSVNRPASYCGILGYKPTFGLVDRTGVKQTCESLDTVGLLGRELEDLRLGAVALGVASLDSVGAASPVPGPPRLAFAPTEVWGAVEPDAAGAIEAWVEGLRGRGVEVDDLELPGYERLAEAQETIQDYETARSLAPEFRDHRPEFSEKLRDMIERGLAMPEVDYRSARSAAAELGVPLTARLSDYDAVLTPSATGVPPVGIASTGNPLFCRAWTLVGAPSLSVPLVWSAAGLPVGVQLVAAPGEDRGLYGAAAWLLD